MPGPYTIPYVPIPYAGGSATARLADLIRQSGADQAEARNRSGAINAYLWGNLGNTISNTVGQIAQAQANEPLRKAQLAEIQGRTDDRARALSDANALDAAQSPISAGGVPRGMTGPPDPSQPTVMPTRQQVLDALPGHLRPSAEKHFQELDIAAATLKKLKGEGQDAERDYFGALGAGVHAFGNDPQAAIIALQHAKENGYGDQADEILKQIQANPDPAFIGQITASLMAQSPKFAQKATPEPKTREVKTIGPNGEEVTKIVPDTPGQSFPVPPPAAPAPKKYEVTVKGPNGGPVTKLFTEDELAKGVDAYRAPDSTSEPLVAIMGKDGNPVLVPRAQAIGQRPASTREQGRAVTSGDAGRIAEFDSALDDLGTLGNTLGTTGAASRAGAALPNVVTELTGWGADAKARQGTIDRIKQVIGKTLEGGVLRKEDEIKYEKILPTIGDPPSVAKTKLLGLQAAIRLKRQRQLESLADAGYDTSKFAADYQPLKTITVHRDANGKLVTN